MSTLLADRRLGVARSEVGLNMHVAHGVLSLDVGGLERIVLDLARAGRRAGQCVSIICLDRPGALAAEAVSLDARIVCLDKLPGRDRATRDRAVEIFSSLKPDIVHTHQISALWHLGPAARAAGLPVLHTEHGNHLARHKHWLTRVKTRFVLNRAARFAGRFCCVSDEIARAVTRWRVVPRGKVEVVVNGVRTESFAEPARAKAVRRSFGIPPDARVVGTVGRLDEVKRQDLLLQALAILRARFADLHLLLVGDGPERGKLEVEAARHGISDRVHFAGYQPLPEAFYGAMDAFALTSRSEGLPVSLLEAWAAALPVVCSDVGAIPQVVTPGVNGLIFPSGDLIGLCERLALLLQDRSAAQRLGQAGQALVGEKYSLEQMSADYAARYRDLIAAPTGRR